MPPHKRLLVVTCVGVWVVTIGSVSCLGNSQVITKSSLKFVSLAPISCCLWWLVSCRGRKPTLRLRPTLLHKSADQGQIYKFQAAFSDDLWVAEAGNRPYGYDPHSYTSHHRQQLIGGKLSNFRQVFSNVNFWTLKNYSPCSTILRASRQNIERAVFFTCQI